MFNPAQPEPEPTFTFIDFLPTVSLVPLLIGAAICYVVCLLSPGKRSLIPLGAGFYGILVLYSIAAGTLYTYVVFLDDAEPLFPTIAFRYWFWGLLAAVWGHFAIRRSRNPDEGFNYSPFIGGGGFVLLGLGATWGGLPGTLLMFAGIAAAVIGGVLFFRSARLMHSFGVFWVLGGLGATLAALQQPFVAGFLLLFAELGLCFLLLIEHEVRIRPVEETADDDPASESPSQEKKRKPVRKTDFRNKFKQTSPTSSAGAKIKLSSSKPPAATAAEREDDPKTPTVADESETPEEDSRSAEAPRLSTEPGRHQGNTKVDPWTGAAIEEPESPKTSDSSDEEDDEEDSIAKKYRLSDD